jgi:hypothetical protein
MNSTMPIEAPSTTTPCNECAVPVDSDIHAEELGMCLDCSNDYWDHTGKWED